MNRWKTLPLAEACEKITDGTHHSPPIQSVGIPYVTAKHIKADGPDFFSDPWFVSENDHRAIFSRCDPRPGDVLYIKDGATTGIAAVNRYAFEFSMLSSVALLRPRVAVLTPEFLCHWLNASLNKHRILGGMAGVAIRRLTLEKINAIRISLPPVLEQQRITTILDKADELRAKRRAALAKLDILTQSIFLDMFGDPATNPKGMRKQPLGKLIKLKSGDFLPATEMAPSGVHPVLGGNGISGYHDTYMFEEPQIVIGRVGVYCGCVHVSPSKSWVTDNALYISDRDAALSFDYLVHALSHARLNRYASQFGQPLVSGSRIYPVAVLVPPKDLQEKFSARIRRAEELVEAHKSSATALDSLFVSLQHRAFNGEV